MIPITVIKQFLDLPPPNPTAPGIFRLAKPGHLAGTLQQAGLTNLFEEEFVADVNLRSGEEYYASVMDIAAPIQNLFAKLSDEQKEKRVAASSPLPTNTAEQMALHSPLLYGWSRGASRSSYANLTEGEQLLGNSYLEDRLNGSDRTFKNKSLVQLAPPGARQQDFHGCGDLSFLRPTTVLGVLGLLLVIESWTPFRASIRVKVPPYRHQPLHRREQRCCGSNLLFSGMLILVSRQAEGWGLLHYLGLGPLANVAASVVLLDLTFYGFHWANHIIPFLWRFHRAHHSDLELDVTTAFRFHLGEVLISMLIKAMAVILLGIPVIGLLLFEHFWSPQLNSSTATFGCLNR